MSILTAKQHLGFAFETTYGTPAPATFWIPVSSVKPQDEIKKIKDEGRRANLSKTFGVYDGIASSTIDFDCSAYPDALGYLLKAMLGQDTPSGSNPNYTHLFKTPTGLAPSMSLSYFNGAAEHQYAGSVMSELAIKFDTEEALGVSAKFIGQKSTTIAETTPVYSTVNPLMGWGTQVSIGGSANLNVVGGELTFKREAKLLYGANNSQAPNKFSSGRLDIGMKLTFDIEDETELALLGGTDKAVQLTFNTGSPNTNLVCLFTLCDIAKTSIDTSQEFARVDMELTPIYNATDAGLCQITLKNQVATY